MLEKCTYCNNTTLKVLEDDGTETCYHRCPECGQPFYGFFNTEEAKLEYIVDNYKCTLCGDSFVYSWSLLSNFMSCPKYALFANDLGRTRSTVAMRYGSGIHCGIDVLQKTRDIEAAVAVFRGEFGFPIGWHDMSSDEQKKLLRTPDKGEGILRAFWQKFQDHPIMTDVGLNEESGVLEIGPSDMYGGQFLYSGKIDRLSERRVIDWKTTSYFGRESFEDTYNMSHQMTGYACLASVLTGEPVEDIEVVLIRVAKGTARRTKAELALGKEPYDDAFDFKILPQKRRPHQTESFINTIRMAVKWWNDCRRSGFWPEWTPYCYHYNNACVYLEYCQMPLDLAISQLKYEFDLRSWNPIKGEETILRGVEVGGPIR